MSLARSRGAPVRVETESNSMPSDGGLAMPATKCPTEVASRSRWKMPTRGLDDIPRRQRVSRREVVSLFLVGG